MTAVFARRSHYPRDTAFPLGILDDWQSRKPRVAALLAQEPAQEYPLDGLVVGPLLLDVGFSGANGVVNRQRESVRIEVWAHGIGRDDLDVDSAGVHQRLDQVVEPALQPLVQVLLGHVDDAVRQIATFFRLLAATGLRISEALALRWRDLQLDGSSPNVKVRRAYVRGRFAPPKSKYGRRDVPLPYELVIELRSRLNSSDRSGPNDLVFPSRAGTPMAAENLRRRVLAPAAEEAGASWAGFHAFRHTCASLLFAEGRNAVQVQRWLGHHSPAFTLSVYVHLLDGDVGAPLELSEVLNGANEVRTGEPATIGDPSEHEFTEGQRSLGGMGSR